MALIKNDKVYRNLQEQVYENTCDIQELLRMYGYHGPYTSTDVIPNDDLYNRAMYLIGTGMPYKVYQYSDLTKRFTYIGDYNMDVGPEGPPGPQGPQGERGPDGKPASEIVNIETYDVIYKEDVTESKVRANFDDGHSNEFSVYAKNGSPGPEGPAGPQGPQGEQGIQGPRGPKGPSGKDGTTSITVNGNKYTQVGSNITLPDYPTSSDFDNLVTTDTKQYLKPGAEKIYLNRNLNYEVCLFDDDIRGISLVTTKDHDHHYSNISPEFIGAYDEMSRAGISADRIWYQWQPGNTNPEFKIELNRDVANYYYYRFVWGKSGEVAVTSDIPDVSNFVTNTDLETTLGNYELKSDAFSGDYNDLTNKPTIPTKTSELTNDSDFIDSSALIGLATETYANNAANNAVNSLDQTLAQVAKTGSYSDLSDKPDLTIYELKSEAFKGNYEDLTNKPDLSVYELKSDAFSGDYNDLTNKPIIPVVNYPVTSVNSKTGDVVLAAADINAKDNNTIQANIDRIDSNVSVAQTNIANIKSDLTRIENKIPTTYLKNANVAGNTLYITRSDGTSVEFEGGGSSTTTSPYVQCEYNNGKLIFTYNNGEGNKYNAISNKITINGTNYSWSGLSATIDVDTTVRGWNVKVVSTLTLTSGTIYSAYIVNPTFVDNFATTDQIPDVSKFVTTDTEQTITANKTIRGTFSVQRADGNSTAFRVYNDQANQISFAGWKIVDGKNVRTWYNLPLYDTQVSKTIATTDQIPTDYVDLSTAQTVGGAKTFSDAPTVPNIKAQGSSESTVYGSTQMVHTFKNNTTLNLKYPSKTGNKTIATTDDIKRYYRHTIICKNGSTAGNNGMAAFDIIDTNSTNYNTLENIVTAMGDKHYTAAGAIYNGSTLMQPVMHVYVRNNKIRIQGSAPVGETRPTVDCDLIVETAVHEIK